MRHCKNAMKIIISHDVDHLYALDHWMHDLIIPKLWIRSFIQLCRRQIGFSVFIHRLLYGFQKKWGYTKEVLEFDREHGIPSTFFFGMRRGLGMSYSVNAARKIINYVNARKFDIGVHGIEFSDVSGMQEEYKQFKNIAGGRPYGIRMHYVRKDESTLRKLSGTGYLFDSTEFDKKGMVMRGPYKINTMWEFPLHIMDGYVIKVGDAEQSRKNTLCILEKVKKQGLPYCTILFHDYYFNPGCYPQEREWYIWLIQYLKEQGYKFISFKDAIKELEHDSGYKNNKVCEQCI